MTLNLTLLTPSYTLQVSDRRMISIPDGAVIDDEANKAVVLQAKDGTFAATFAGIGSIDGERIDVWLAKKLTKLSLPEMTIREGAEVIAREATSLFRRIPAGVNKTHAFVLAGHMSGSPYPGVWVVTNESTRNPGVASSKFAVRETILKADSAMPVVSGFHRAIKRSGKRRLEATLRTVPRPDKAERALVDVARHAASDAEGKRFISKDVLAVALLRQGTARARFYPHDGPTKNFAPLFVWHDSGVNFAAGGLDITPGNFAAVFGTSMFVAPPDGQESGGPGQNLRSINFRFWFDRGQQEESLPDSEVNVPLVHPIPLSKELMESFS